MSGNPTTALRGDIQDVATRNRQGHTFLPGMKRKDATPKRRQESTVSLRQQSRRQPGRGSPLMLPMFVVFWMNLVSQHGTKAFTMVPVVRSTIQLVDPLQAAGGSKKKRRKRKQSTAPPSAESPTPLETPNESPLALSTEQDDEETVDISMINEVANFRFEPKNEGGSTATKTDPDATATMGNRGTAIPLPDIKEARLKKQIEEELAKKEEEDEANKVRIKRSDKEAFRKVRAYRYCCD